MFVTGKKKTLRVRPLREVLKMPELCDARFTKTVECPDANQIEHLGGTGIHAVVKIPK